MKKISKLVFFFLVLLVSFFVAGCKKTVEIPSVILDGDFGSSTDDLFALQMLYRYADAGKVNFLGVIVDREGIENAKIVDVMNTYYGHSEVPIGLVKNGITNPKVWIDYSELPNYTDENGNKIFNTSVEDYEQLPDGYILYRKLLSESKDNSVSICSVGFLPCLTQLLQSEGDEYSPLIGVELVRKKVKCVYIMGGVFGPSLEKDFNFAQGIDFSKDFFALFPANVDIIFSPGEVGDRIEYLPNDVISDIDWTDIHPIKQVYLNCNCYTGQKMWDPLTVINAVEGNKDFLLSPRGFVEVTDEAQTIFVENEKGNSRYQLPQYSEWNTKILDKIRASD